MNIPNKLLGTLLVCSVVLNIYQYHSVNRINFTSSVELKDELSSIKETNNSLHTDKSVELKPILNLHTRDSTKLNNKNLTSVNNTEFKKRQMIEENPSNDVNSQAELIEYELSLYLDEEVVNLVQKAEEEKRQIINMLNNNDVRQQDIEYESQINSLLENYSESVQSGSQDVRCNASGCYVSYILVNSNAANHIFLDFPRLAGSSTSGYTIQNSDGTYRYVDFILIQ